MSLSQKPMRYKVGKCWLCSKDSRLAAHTAIIDHEWKSKSLAEERSSGSKGKQKHGWTLQRKPLTLLADRNRAVHDREMIGRYVATYLKPANNVEYYIKISWWKEHHPVLSKYSRAIGSLVGEILPHQTIIDVSSNSECLVRSSKVCMKRTSDRYQHYTMQPRTHISTSTPQSDSDPKVTSGADKSYWSSVLKNQLLAHCAVSQYWEKWT